MATLNTYAVGLLYESILDKQMALWILQIRYAI